MSNIQIKNVPDDLHRAARRRAESESMTLSDYLLDVLQRDLAIPSRREWFASLASDEPVEVDSVALIAAARAERDTELAEAQH